MDIGTAPLASLPHPAARRVLALGVDPKNRACLLEGHAVHWSAPHGDLREGASRAALALSVETLLARASGPVQAVAHDLHPDFYSTQLALALAQRLQVPAVGVQHHHAHLAVALAEQALAGPVIGLALDGLGLGPDGSAWGGEILQVQGSAAAHQWQRLEHLTPLALPGGDAAAREPWRLAAAVLFALGRGQEIEPRWAPVVGVTAARLIHQMLQRGVNCPVSSSAGRWFDAAAGALGLCVRQSTEAQAARGLAQLASVWWAQHPGVAAWAQGAEVSLDLHPLVGALSDLSGQGPEACGRGAALFHEFLTAALAQRAVALAATYGASTVVLAGGCWANQALRQRVVAQVQAGGCRVLLPRQDCGDGGLALGQAWVAACTPVATTAMCRASALALEA